MENPEKLATLGTQDTGQRQTKHKNRAPHRKLRSGCHESHHKNKPGMNPGALEGLTVPASYKTPVVVLMYIFRSGETQFHLIVIEYYQTKHKIECMTS